MLKVKGDVTLLRETLHKHIVSSRQGETSGIVGLYYYSATAASVWIFRVVPAQKKSRDGLGLWNRGREEDDRAVLLVFFILL